MKLTKEEVAVADIVFRAPTPVSMKLGQENLLVTMRSISHKLEQAKAEANGSPAEVDLEEGERNAMRQLFANFDMCALTRSHELIEAATGFAAQLFAPDPEPEGDDERIVPRKE